MMGFSATIIFSSSSSLALVSVLTEKRSVVGPRGGKTRVPFSLRDVNVGTKENK